MRNAQKIFISVLLLFALSLSASAAVTWTTATDAGYYDIDGEPLLGENADVGEPDEWYYYFAKYKTNTSGRINQMEIVSFYRDIDTKFSTEEGFYLVNALSLRNNFLSFYDTDSDVVIADEAALSYKCAEDCAVIRLDDNTYAGEELIRVPDNEDELRAWDEGNSVIYVNSDGEIGKIYSFTENYIV
ncbi:MAG: hypothetical protein E7441_00065 [Ruminococcaceae bacterium]|nr:hypothetical protein [Oscillospiraceae bacterium]